MDTLKKFLIESWEKSNSKVNLDNWDPKYGENENESKLEEELSNFADQISKFQYKLYADKSMALLIILQGVDASGKDGTIRHVMGALNPQNCSVKSFRIPNSNEIEHDYLWRVHKEIPSKGQINIFNRSHYEDIIESKVNRLISKKDLNKRYRQINDFERYLSENNITILKFFLHISKDEQRKRLLERINDPTKYWKLKESDFVDHNKWKKYMKAYESILTLCSTKFAPWYIIPSNTKHFRDWAISSIVLFTLKKMNPTFPNQEIDFSKFIIT